MVDVAAQSARNYQILALRGPYKVYPIGETNSFSISVEQPTVLKLKVLTFSDGFVDLIALQHERQLIGDIKT